MAVVEAIFVYNAAMREQMIPPSLCLILNSWSKRQSRSRTSTRRLFLRSNASVKKMLKYLRALTKV